MEKNKHGFSYLLREPKEHYVDNERIQIDKLPADLQVVFSDCRFVPRQTIATNVKGRCVLYPIVHGDEQWLPPTEHRTDYPEYSVLSHGIVDPALLIRANDYPGYRVTDRTGHSWSIPIISMHDPDRGSLPKGVSIDPVTMQMRLDVLPEYRSLFDDIRRVTDYREKGIGEKPTEQDYLDLSMRILQVNYRINLAALAHNDKLIGDVSFQSDDLVQIIIASAEWHLLDEMKKKRETENSSSPTPVDSPKQSSGQEESIDSDTALQSVS